MSSPTHRGDGATVARRSHTPHTAGCDSRPRYQDRRSSSVRGDEDRKHGSLCVLRGVAYPIPEHVSRADLNFAPRQNGAAGPTSTASMAAKSSAISSSMDLLGRGIPDLTKGGAYARA